MIFMSIFDPLGAAAGPTVDGGGDEAAVRVVVVVVVGVGRRVVIHPGSLWAVGMEPCNNSHPCIQQLRVFSHLTFSPSKHPFPSLSLSPNTLSFLPVLPFFGRKGKKNPPGQQPYFPSLQTASFLSFPPGKERKRKERKRKRKTKERKIS